MSRASDTMQGLFRVLVLVVVLEPFPAQAQSERPVAALTYTRAPAADRCPEESSLRDAVSARLGYVPFVADAKTRIDVSITRRGRALEALVQVREAGAEDRTRTLRSSEADCEELADAVALAVSIAIDPLSLTRAPAPPPPPPPPPSLPPPPPIPSPTPAAAPVTIDTPPPPAPAVRTLRVGLDGLGALGAVPGASAGLAAHAGLYAVRWSGSLEARVDLPRSTEAAQGEARGLRVLGRLVPCARFGWGFACALGSAGLFSARGEGARPEHTRHAFVAALGARAGAELALRERLWLCGYAELEGLLTPLALEVAGREAWRTPPLSGALGAGIAGAFR